MSPNLNFAGWEEDTHPETLCACGHPANYHSPCYGLGDGAWGSCDKCQCRSFASKEPKEDPVKPKPQLCTCGCKISDHSDSGECVGSCGCTRFTDDEIYVKGITFRRGIGTRPPSIRIISENANPNPWFWPAIGRAFCSVGRGIAAPFRAARRLVCHQEFWWTTLGVVIVSAYVGIIAYSTIPDKYCPICDQGFDSRSEYEREWQSETRVMWWKCNDCKATWYERDGIRIEYAPSIPEPQPQDFLVPHGASQEAG